MSTSKAYSHSLSYSDSCAKGGDGICDGYIPEDETYAGEECGCGCHADYTVLPNTVEGVTAWHREQDEFF